MKSQALTGWIDALRNPENPLHDEAQKRIADWCGSETAKNLQCALSEGLIGAANWIDQNRPLLDAMTRLYRESERKKSILELAEHESLEAVVKKYPDALNVLLDANIEARRVENRLEPVVKTGTKIKSSTKKGHEAVHGTLDEKQSRWDDYQARVDELHKENPRWKYRQIAEKAAKEFEVNEKTIRRHTKNPLKN